MASKEIEQQVEEKYLQVKKELHDLKVAIKKQESLAARTDRMTLVSPETTDLFIERKDDNTKKSLSFEQGIQSKTLIAKKKKTMLDVTPGDHTVVEL